MSDLTLIENLCTLLKRQAYARKRTHLNSNIQKELSQKLVDGYQKHVVEVQFN